MFKKEILNTFTLVASDKNVRLSAAAVTFFTFLLGVFVSPLVGLVVYVSYIFGYVLCWCIIKYQSNASVYLQEAVSFCYRSSFTRKKLRHSCSVCDDFCCRRDKQSKIITPWKHLFVQKDLNQALEQFYNKILDNFIVSWYTQFTKDEDFINELRLCLRYVSATLLNRFLDINHADIISKKLLPCVVKHVDDYLYMQQIMKLKNARFNDVIVEYLGKRLHVATSNRKNELSYLQHLSAALMPHILPEKSLECRNFNVLFREIFAGWVFLPLMDVLADPNIINSLVIIATTYDYKNLNKSKDNKETVEFLENFVPYNQKSSFATDLSSIKDNTNLLYCFMQFLKREEHVHLLQFCLDVDEFNNKLLTPELSKKQLEELHQEAMKLYNEYLDQTNLNFIGCPDEIVHQFYALIKDGVYSVAKLRTSKPLYQAYEHTCNVLESIWLPSFFHSNEFYSHICGSKITATYNKVSNQSRKYYETQHLGTVAKISSGLGKIKGALKATPPIEGALYPPVFSNLENGTVEDVIISEGTSIFRDLSAWRVSISSYQTTNKVVSFCVNVQRLDVVPDEETKQNWVVLRKDQDFYTLKAKLVEFHGESEICDSPLPSRKAGSSLDIRMSKYEDFLKRLLQKPSLRGSDLLHTFLTTEEDFTVATSTQNSQDIGNIYLSVAHKLRKEKGQHLDSFMATFLSSSTEKAKQGKFEWAELGDEVDVRKARSPPALRTFRNHIFNDNFGIPFKVPKDSSSSINPVGITECTFYLLKYIFKVPHFVLRMYAAVCSVAQDAIESYLGSLIERSLKSSLCPANLTYLIKLLEDVVFLPRTPPTKAELEKRRERAFEELKHVIPSYLRRIVGDQFPTGMTTLLEILQHPHYNKQLMYNLLDLILIEMYPSLLKSLEDQ